MDDFIDNFDPESPDWAELINMRFYNALISKTSLEDLLEGDYLDKKFSNMSLQLTPKTKNS